MFQDALLESGGQITTESRYFGLAGLGINSCILLAMVLWPLLHPLTLPKQALSMLLIAPAPPPPAVAMIKTAMAPVVRASSLAAQLLAPSRISTHIAKAAEDSPSDAGAGLQPMPGGMVSSMPGGIFEGPGTASRPLVRAAVPVKIAISSGVMAGNKVAGANPVYPAIAKAARLAGTVVLVATISKNGTIENLRVTSGPPLLTASAMAAVKTWVYRPYLLNGEPVEVETTVNVIFNLGN